MKVKQIVYAGSSHDDTSNNESIVSALSRHVKRGKRKAGFDVKDHLTLTAPLSTIFCHTITAFGTSAKPRRPALTPQEWLPFTRITMLLRLL
jgi:hypothetical protein